MPISLPLAGQRKLPDSRERPALWDAAEPIRCEAGASRHLPVSSSTGEHAEPLRLRGSVRVIVI